MQWELNAYSYNLKSVKTYIVSPKVIFFTEDNYLIAHSLRIDGYDASQGDIKITGDDLSLFQFQIGLNIPQHSDFPLIQSHKRTVSKISDTNKTK